MRFRIGEVVRIDLADENVVRKGTIVEIKEIRNRIAYKVIFKSGNETWFYDSELIKLEYKIARG